METSETPNQPEPSESQIMVTKPSDLDTSPTSNQQETTPSQLIVDEGSHPASQLPPRPRRRRTWLVAGIVIFGVGLAAWQLLRSKATQTAPQPPSEVLVKVQKVQSSPVKTASTILGTLVAKQGVVLRPNVSGHITQISTSAGDTVAPGESIIQLSPEKTQADLGAAVANINAAEATSNNAKAQLREVEASRVSAVAELALQNTEFERTEKLVKQGALAQQALDQVKRDRAAAQSALSNVDEQIQAAKATLTQVQAALKQSQASAKSAQVDFKDTRITAPIAGIVGDIPVKLGAFVQAGDTLTTITQNRTLELNLNIPVDKRDQLQVGLPVELSQPQSNQPLAKGRISFISPTVGDNQLILAKATVPNPQGKLQDGQRVTAKVIWQSRPGVLVPATAIRRIGGKAFVFIADQLQQQEGPIPSMVARQQPVELGSIQGNDYQIFKGVKTGETVVVSGLQNVMDGASLLVHSDNPPANQPSQ